MTSGFFLPIFDTKNFFRMCPFLKIDSNTMNFPYGRRFHFEKNQPQTPGIILERGKELTAIGRPAK